MLQADWEEEDFYDDYYYDDDDHRAGGGSQGGRAYMAALNNATHRLVLAGTCERAHVCAFMYVIDMYTVTMWPTRLARLALYNAAHALVRAGLCTV